MYLSVYNYILCIGKGKRKLRFDKLWMKEEASKDAWPTCICATYSNHLPLSLYLQVTATCPSTLFSWLRSTGSLEERWMMADPLENNLATSASQSYMLYKMGWCHSTMLPFVLFTVTISGDCTWTLMVCEEQADIENYQKSPFSSEVSMMLWVCLTTANFVLGTRRRF